MSISTDQEGRALEFVPNLHDATLNAVNFDWSSGIVHITLEISVATFGVIEARGVTTELRCPRLLAWGPSSSINSAAVETLAEVQRLKIEMQSGDVLEICAREVEFRPGAE
jgi:hypothetical protein